MKDFDARAAQPAMPTKLRLLFVSNLFPPVAQGGYEQWCKEVALAMQGRGHSVAVLTAFAGGTIADNGTLPIHRVLYPEVSGGVVQTMKRLIRDRQRVEDENIANLQRILDEFQPDVIFVWGMWNIPRSVPAALEAKMPSRVVYYFCDYWPCLPNAYIQRWEAPAKRKHTQLLKQMFGKFFLAPLYQEASIALQLEHPACVSQAVRDLLVRGGAPVEHARIIYGGTQVEDFALAAASPKPALSQGLKLLYLGRLVADKGVHTAIEALGLLAQGASCPVTLDVYGKGDPDYKAHLHGLIQHFHLENTVTLCGSLPRAEVPNLLARYHALVFPSVWDEPFARTTLEAMAAGVVVVGTTTGGTGEILTDGETGLTFPVENAQVLATQLRRLFDDPTLYTSLSKNAHARVHQHFTFQRMVDEFEEVLTRVAASASLN